MTENSNPRVSTVLPGGQEQKAQWDQYADDHPEVSNVSHLIRLSVEKEMDGHHDGNGGNGGTDQEVAEKLAEVIETNQAVANRLENLQRRMRTIENEIGSDPVIAEVKNDVFAALPSREKCEEYQDPEAGPLPAFLPEEQGGPVAYSGTVADIARVLDERESVVEKALDSLASDTARVRQIDGGQWVKEV